jgi:cell division protein FtsQ
MATKRKTKNKRFKRRHLLKVKMRTSELRKVRLRRLAYTLTMLLLLGSLVFVVWRGGEIFLRWALYENPYFETHAVLVETDGVLHRDPIRQWAGVQLGQNLFALDLRRVRRDLELIPYIRTAEIERVLPNTLRIQVSEREPLARFQYPQLAAATAGDHGIYLVDVEGYLMQPLAPEQCTRPEDAAMHRLPYLTGISLQEIRSGRRLESPQTKAGLELLAAFDKSPMAGLVDLHFIDLRTPGVLEVLTRKHSQVTFLPGHFAWQLHRWRAIYDLSSRSGRLIEKLDLSVTNNLPLILRQRAAWPEPRDRSGGNHRPNQHKNV